MTYEKLLIDLCKKNESLIVLTAENRAHIRNFPSEMPERFLDVGIAEMTLCGVSAGLALRGRKPIAHALASFLVSRAYEFIKIDIAYPKLPVKLVGYVPGLLSLANGPTHQAIDDIGLMCSLPNMNVFVPSDLEDLLICLPEIINSSEPFYIRYVDIPKIIEHNSKFEIGKAEIFGTGEKIVFISMGILLKEALNALAMLENKGIDSTVINLRTIKPIDEQLIIEVSRKADLVVTIEDHLLESGIYSIVSKLLQKAGIATKVIPIGLNTYFKPALNINEIIEFEGLSAQSIINKIL